MILNNYQTNTRTTQKLTHKESFHLYIHPCPFTNNHNNDGTMVMVTMTKPLYASTTTLISLSTISTPPLLKPQTLNQPPLFHDKLPTVPDAPFNLFSDVTRPTSFSHLVDYDARSRRRLFGGIISKMIKIRCLVQCGAFCCSL